MRFDFAHQPGDVTLASLSETLARTRRVGDKGDKENNNSPVTSQQSKVNSQQLTLNTQPPRVVMLF
ncbi:hypothetical protein H6G94_26135 [Nostoc punctiforme FACHB-252]|uniref:Uncharacterized protein n=1 Tax=Nostoc punctiforme FACHB-252 TaxID=1357509 RepID=A0ABR8HHS2_NOSPU|nr:hypothetical protein [Nostoc punctiforme]MBD2614712.1 hypothetical protein [Nostoc punctiforme FACHB-252]